MIEVPEFFAPSAEEAQRMAARTQELETARAEFLQAQAVHEARTGIVGSVIGKIGLRRTTKHARQQGLTVVNGDVIVPVVVPQRYLIAMEDNY